LREILKVPIALMIYNLCLPIVKLFKSLYEIYIRKSIYTEQNIKASWFNLVL